jgi:hypothetical protein
MRLALACLLNVCGAPGAALAAPRTRLPAAPRRAPPSNASHFEIAPGVSMPWLSNGAIGYPKSDQEQAGIEAWLAIGGRGVDTAWRCA